MAQGAAGSLGLLAAGPPTAGGTAEYDEDRSFARDLNLDQIVAAIAGDREERDLITRVLFTPLHDADAVRYRQEVFQDRENPVLLAEVRHFSELIGEVRAHLRRAAKMEERYQREGWLLDAAAIYCGAARSLSGHLASAQIGSRALLAFRDYLASYVASAGFTALTADTRSQQEALGQVRYCVRIRGDRVEVSRYQGEADYSAEVLRTFERFKQGAVKDYRIAYRRGQGSTTSPPRSSNWWPGCSRRSSPPWTSTAAGTPRSPTRASCVQAAGKSLVIITGANSGGKSTFLRSVGVAQLMMQSGLFVTAGSYRANVARGIFTHFIREEDADMTSGRLDDELRRMSAIADRIAPGCLMLFNESFAGTNEREGSEIGRQVVSALLDAGITVFFVTHRFGFAQHFHRQQAGTTLFLRAKRQPDGRRNYKLAVKDLLPTSFGEDRYYRLGGWLEEDTAASDALAGRAGLDAGRA